MQPVSSPGWAPASVADRAPAPSLTVVDGVPRCHHFDAFRCRSCTLLGTPRDRQLADKEAHARSLVGSPVWLPTVAGADARFRNKATMVVGGIACLLHALVPALFPRSAWGRSACSPTPRAGVSVPP